MKTNTATSAHELSNLLSHILQVLIALTQSKVTPTRQILYRWENMAQRTKVVCLKTQGSGGAEIWISLSGRGMGYNSLVTLPDWDTKSVASFHKEPVKQYRFNCEAPMRTCRVELPFFSSVLRTAAESKDGHFFWRVLIAGLPAEHWLSLSPKPFNHDPSRPPFLQVPHMELLYQSTISHFRPPEDKATALLIPSSHCAGLWGLFFL